MPDDANRELREQELTMHVFTLSAGLVGVCLTGIGLLRLIANDTHVNTIADDLLAGDALVFMNCCFLSFWSFKTRLTHRQKVLRIIIDAFFMAALATMVLVCALITYAIA
jgi:hypothetical protein